MSNMQNISDMDWDNGRGLPRSLAEDPFFQYHHQRNSPSAEYFRDFPPTSNGGPTRRFGSNPRLYDNVGPNDRFFDDLDQQNSFNSLPRRNSQSRSPRPPSSAGERTVPVQRQNQSIPLPPPSPQPVRKADPEPQQQKPQPPVIHIHNTQPAVEINNSPPSSYTNGALNPDRAHLIESLSNANSTEDISTSDNSSSLDHSQQRESSNGTPPSKHTNEDNSEHSVSMNVKPKTNGVEVKKAGFNRKTSIDGCGDQLIHLLDDAEARVEQLRDAAAKLEIEKEQILDILGNLKLNSEILRLGEGERDDINVTADRILKRCKAVDVVVNTPRSEEQSKALEEVNDLIQNVVQKMQNDLDSTKDVRFQTVQRFLNACSPDEPNGLIDQRFQAKVIECTADDQKKIRRRLAQIISQIDRAERVCVPNF